MNLKNEKQANCFNGAGGDRTHVQTPANIFIYNHRLCIDLTKERHIAQASFWRAYQSLFSQLGSG